MELQSKQPGYMKGGVPNEKKLALKKLLIYIRSVYQIPGKIKGLSDGRKRRSIPSFNVVMSVFVALLLQYESFHTVFSSPESMGRRLKHLIKGRVPKVDAVRDVLTRLDPKELEGIHRSVIKHIRRNGVQRSGTVGRYMVAAIDGVELFSSTKKSCPACLTRKNQAGKTEYFHRSVVCASVGRDPHIIYGQEMLKPRDSAEKDEGELTGGKRLIRRLKKQFGHFADVIVADALYLNAPFINTVLQCGMDVVIRLKDENRLIFQDAERMFQKGIGRQQGFRKKYTEIAVWDLSGFEMTNIAPKMRVVKFQEKYRSAEKAGEKTRCMWLVTTLMTTDYRCLWEMMHKRWDIENNAFHQLKTYYHAKHCYCHSAVEVIFILQLIAFNIRELFLFCRVADFEKSKTTRKSATRQFRDDLLLQDFKPLLYNDSG